MKRGYWGLLVFKGHLLKYTIVNREIIFHMPKFGHVFINKGC